ncbi:orotate phosphoribosyltransferase [Sediminicurvatus halobius]|uniref:Orotate phosphoribosyltransferase n=1 Tax=Sediminicurvatus halobius TaxID=2182432 RepID=A0A2U2N266_9GAMM|nr:orotate phosphoribosyltransferase [Spiribacter halobius]PWG63163.1 orotate phosphoribosyltransferase [Spiribacter halobius]UEX79924.1 orotate phosphoribosyltransferase [Spiribacter halobius]
MRDYQRDLIEFALEHGVLRFGEFTLKSGRVSPYFFNTGLFDSGDALRRLGHAYACAALDAELQFDMLFGPAYKGIPLVAATAIGLAEVAGRDVPWAFNRKEEKDHGEGGHLVGAPLQGRVLVVDDVISAGTSVAESVALIEAAGARLAGVLVALDRQERGTGERSATQEVAASHGVPVTAIIDLDALTDYLRERGDPDGHLPAIERYRVRYGVR